MLNRYILSLFLLVSFGSMQAMTILQDIDTSLLGLPHHQVTVFESNHRTVYAAYPKESLITLNRHKLFNQCATALSTTSFLYMGYKAITNAISNSFNYVTASASYPIAQQHVSAYIALSGLSYALARLSWGAYDNASKLYQRLINYNTQDALFPSEITASQLPENNHEIAEINAANPNLIWVRVSHDFMSPPAYDQIPLVAIAPPYESNDHVEIYPSIDAHGANMYAHHQPPAIIRPAPAAEAPLACPLCPTIINKRDAAANMALPCGHVFHVNCIRPTAGDPHGLCPVCNTAINQ